LKDELQSFLGKISLVPIRILRANERVGLTMGRLIGAKYAQGKVLIFLDSHCECTTGWIEPLLSRIVEDRLKFVSLFSV